MCRLFSDQKPESYARANRSVRIGRHSTSIQLEMAFWALLDDIAADQKMTTARLVSALYEEALAVHGTVGNFSSLLRTSCLLFARSQRPGSGKKAKQPKRAAYQPATTRATDSGV